MALPLLALIGYGAAKLGQKSSDKRAAREQAEAETAEGRAIQGLIEGSGFQVGPGVNTNPEEQQRLGGISRSLMSQNTDIRQAGIEQLQGMAPPSMREQIALESDRIGLERANVGLETDRLGLESAGAGLEAARADQAFNAQQRPLTLAQQQLDLATAYTDYQHQQAVRKREQEVSATVIPLLPEQVPMINPLTGRADNVAIAGPEYQKMQGSTDAYSRNLSMITDMIGLIDENGSEIGGEVGTRMNNLYTGILFGSIQARGGGAPQEAELELAAKGLPLPTSFAANLRGSLQALAPWPGGAAIMRQRQEAKYIAGYKQLHLDTSRAIYDQLRINPSLQVDVDKLDPRVWINPAERDYYRANTGVNLVTQ